MSVKSSPSLPQLGLVLLCLAWLVPGLVGHAPWKGGDGDQFVRIWMLVESGAVSARALAAPPLYDWVAAASAWLASPVLALPDGVRLASGLFIAAALVFVARAARVLYGAGTGWAAVLTLLGCLGLLVRGHEINAATAQLGAAAVMLYGMASLPHGRRAGVALGAGAALLLLAGGLAEAALFVLITAALAILHPDYRTPVARRALVLGVGLAVAFAAAWIAALVTASIPFAGAVGLERWTAGAGLRPAYYLGILAWYAWPAWPLAVWAVYRGRRQWRLAGIVLPVTVFAGLLGLYAFDPRPGEEKALVLLLPLALLGAQGLFSLRRGAANALLWFAVMLFGFLGLVLWVYWSAHDLGVPARMAARLAKLGMTDIGELRPWALATGALVTLAWVVFLARVRRSPLRPMLVWTASMVFLWALLMALFLGPLDQRLSYAGVGEELAAQVPADACVQTLRVRPTQRGLLAYHSARRLVPGEAGCGWLLIETRVREAEPAVGAAWVKQWDGARPGDRSDRFHLYARR